MQAHEGEWDLIVAADVVYEETMVACHISYGIFVMAF